MNDKDNNSPEEKESLDFIRTIIANDLKEGKNDGKVITRFPPEPNGFLHIGHAKAICLSFGVAHENNGITHLRFDDTNPTKEDTKYVDAIKNDVKWLGYDWDDRLHYASDYFSQLYDYAVQLIKIGKAYVCDLTPDQIREYRGTLTEPGKESPYRNRTVEENLDLFEKMKAGEFENGTKTIRAKIDMSSGNLNMRDPVIYRIMHASHHRTGDTWCIYPMYDFTHCLSDSIEKITHSLCDLDFEDHRPLYDWFLDELKTPCHPQQIEFARLNISYTILSKRRLRRLVEEDIVDGWDDCRMPTLSGMRRRGFTAETIRAFCARIGVAKRDSMVDLALLEYYLREDLNKSSNRVMAVLNPLKIVIENYPEDKEDILECINNPEDESAGSREVPFSRELYIERDDFMEDPPKKFFRLAPGREVRLRYAYFITCTDVIKDDSGEIVELRCTYDPETKGGNAPDGRRVKATMHWVSAKHAVDSEVRIFDTLFTKENPMDDSDGIEYVDAINPDSVKVLKNCKLEPSLADAVPGTRVQFERLGYFCADTVDSKPGQPVFNRTVTLRDTWAKIQKKQGKKK
ncbi:MAG: glutamine--tRNA ligase/YqeY domain fusion protein [candidate division Zixibacteria bacterium]|nr:glutamine--tRNA ligase/YqeY domain fusion protein [candidate division Zixibacteria bacterium]